MWVGHLLLWFMRLAVAFHSSVSCDSLLLDWPLEEHRWSILKDNLPHAVMFINSCHPHLADVLHLLLQLCGPERLTWW